MKPINAAITSLLARTLPGFESLQDCQRLTGGANQETYAITAYANGEAIKLALRRAAGGQLSSSTHGQPGLTAEARLMALSREAGVPEPEVIDVLKDSDQLGEGFLMRWVDGETLGAKINRQAEFDTIRPQLARQCGEILARIHAIDITGTGLDKVLETLSPTDYIKRLWDEYRRYDTPQPMIDYTARWLLEHAPPPRKACLVHNDFRNGNLMVDPVKGVVAVLDWEVAHLGDPMRDLGWICTNSWRFGHSELEVGGFGHLDDLIAGYEAVSGTPVEREWVHYWEVFGSFWWAVGCLGMADHYRHGPDSSVERPGIGRRSSECQVDCVNLIIPGPATTPGESAEPESNMPRTDELVQSVRDFLRGAVSEETTARTRFLARVAANSLDIVLREQQLGDALALAEHRRLERLLGRQAALETLRRQLVETLRAEEIALDDEQLVRHLRETVLGRVMIDQPGYSGCKTALEAARA